MLRPPCLKGAVAGGDWGILSVAALGYGGAFYIPPTSLRSATPL